ncbi:hypothetical protein BDR04DRAFT_293426 [Suillus decipiens]|nr:hypothetical protein BDR04DRAFT_293426 [Suillus decipiens]
MKRSHDPCLNLTQPSAATIHRPFLDTPTASTRRLQTFRAFSISLPSRRSHRRMVLSPDPLTICLPSGK